ncbi:MAG: PD-(D/E)XK nuclease family protein [Nitrosomonadaceae bacterium]
MSKRRQYVPGLKDRYRISRTKVDLFITCPHCFYLDVRLGIKRPPGFPFSLNSAVDTLLKAEFDQYRKVQLPHPYITKTGLNAVPYSHPKLDIWRNNFKGVSFVHEETGFEAFGAVDDLWIDLLTQEIIVVDYKATSKLNEVSLDADWQIGYKRQMEFYQWLLKKNGLNVANQGWFVYCNGIKDKSAFNERLDFTVSMLPYVGNDSWVEPTLVEIKKCLDSGLIPLATEDCEYCQYALQYATANGRTLLQENTESFVLK